jgi:hypothetical protein
LRIVRVKDFIRLIEQGHPNLTKLIEDVKEAASVSGAFKDYDVLLDVRGLETNLSITELFILAQEVEKLVHSGSPQGFWAKIAVLCPIERFESAKFFELCTMNRGLNVQAFTSVEDLFDWISLSNKPD